MASKIFRLSYGNPERLRFIGSIGDRDGTFALPPAEGTRPKRAAVQILGKSSDRKLERSIYQTFISITSS